MQSRWAGRGGVDWSMCERSVYPPGPGLGLHVPEDPLAKKAVLSPRWHVTTTVWGGQLLRL